MPAATIVFDAGTIENARWAVGIALALTVCVAIYVTWPRWSWEKRR